MGPVSTTEHRPALPSDRAGLEPAALVALLQPVAAVAFYLLPATLQSNLVVLFAPQLLGYLGLCFWAARNTAITCKLGLSPRGFKPGLARGAVIGLVLGGINVSVILWLVPWLGGEIEFLRETPHARMPVLLMLPGGIALIAILVELNFRGFFLGRLLNLVDTGPTWVRGGIGRMLAIGTSAVVFCFDPFMVATFRHLHWIALWDGLVWGLLRQRRADLYGPIMAHTTEVIVLYGTLRLVFP